MKLTVIIPVYNEIKSIKILLEKVLETKIQKQIILVDDFSLDGTREEIINNYDHKIDKIILHEENLGKGAAIKSAQRYVDGDYVIIQDADLEYDPNQYQIFVNEAKLNKYKAIYGSRVLKKDKFISVQNFSHKVRIWGNIFLTFLSNKINNQNLTDAHTCYKMFESNIFKSLNLKEKGFAFCPEVTTKLSNLGISIFEIPINYQGRTYKEGKKIKAIDGLKAILALIRYRFFDK
tara:strand:+ start:914 stop:1615 length:702 start_codon:yes stop_codon:yes gene_type:complete